MNLWENKHTHYRTWECMHAYQKKPEIRYFCTEKMYKIARNQANAWSFSCLHSRYVCDNKCLSLKYTVIFEYKMPTCSAMASNRMAIQNKAAINLQCKTNIKLNSCLTLCCVKLSYLKIYRGYAIITTSWCPHVLSVPQHLC